MANYASNDELMHYGVLGMKWGVHRAKRSTDSNGLTRASKRYDKKVSRGSLHNIVGLAFENQGMKKAADRQYKRVTLRKRSGPPKLIELVMLRKYMIHTLKIYPNWRNLAEEMT